ncbi:hypothetical protein BpHYR1_025249 [Brachionus plicatilis]|uniref:Uncharacterized protein n=1 Tax=Brachionus plicatilis TaxID=10195 RepID=A0A3M7RS79_BRAPC|nr:hypothetical protein BpHYR1_025249 [Brachionus plicatilis]
MGQFNKILKIKDKKQIFKSFAKIDELTFSLYVFISFYSLVAQSRIIEMAYFLIITPPILPEPDSPSEFCKDFELTDRFRIDRFDHFAFTKLILNF